MKQRMLFLLALMSLVSASAQNAFQISSHNMKNIEIRSAYTSNSTYALTSMDSVSDFAASGSVNLLTDNSIVRLILVDSEENEYLVFEKYKFAQDPSICDFSNMAFETTHLNKIRPAYIKIIVYQAEVSLFRFSYKNDSQFTKVDYRQALKSRKADQSMILANKWNEHNKIKQYPWIADRTILSDLTYSEKKTIFRAENDYFNTNGIEYYVGGFFVFPSDLDADTENIPQTRDNNYVDSFDWRNRHGKNWMTSIKNQIDPYDNINGNGGCWAFGSIAALESHANLYFNRLLNLDLSEQELGSCGTGSLHTGGNAYGAYNYILNNGVSNEECFPFQNNCTVPCSDRCVNPQYVVNISNYYSINSATNSLKNELINGGPLASCISNGWTEHLLCLCGYGIIQEGQHLEYVPYSASSDIDTIIPTNSPYIGKTYWIYKNSYGPQHQVNGYMYAVFENDNTRSGSVALSYPVSVSTLTNNDIVCEDNDNDGYYFWGLGPKPANCPICCSDTPDGDDSDPSVAEMDAYGNFAAYTFPYPTTTISSNTTWNTNQTQCGNIIITNNATLTITAELTMNPAAKIIVQNGASLIVDAGTIINAMIDVQQTAKLKLFNDATLYLKQFGNLNVQFGAEADLDYGNVLLQ